MSEQTIKSLTFGQYSHYSIFEAVNNFDWQMFRISLKGISTEKKVERLKEWLKLNSYSLKSKIQVTNYINALKRGGQIKC